MVIILVNGCIIFGPHLGHYPVINHILLPDSVTKISTKSVLIIEYFINLSHFGLLFFNLIYFDVIIPKCCCYYYLLFLIYGPFRLVVLMLFLCLFSSCYS